MATTTTNLKLTKPAYNETADIAVINSNMDTIDSAVKALQDTTSTHTSQITTLQNSVTPITITDSYTSTDSVRTVRIGANGKGIVFKMATGADSGGSWTEFRGGWSYSSTQQNWLMGEYHTYNS